MKKILFMAAIGSDINGADLSLTHQMVYCSQNGFDVHLVATYLTEEYKVFLRNHYITYHQLDYTWWNSQDISDENSNVLDFQAVSSLIELIQSEMIDVTVSNTGNIPQLALAATLTSKPHIWLVHEFPNGEFAYTAEKYDFISNFSNIILTSGAVLADYLRKYYEIEHISNFLPYTEKPVINYQNDQPIKLISVNAITGDGKNHMETIKIFELVQRDYPNLELLITGAIIDKDYYQNLVEYIKDNNIKNITFGAKSDFNDNWSDVNVNDIFINTSKMETFGLTTMEALLLGLRVVVSDGAGTVLSSYGFLPDKSIYPIGDINTAASLIKIQIESPTMRIDYHLGDYSLEKIMKPLIDAINCFDSNPQNGLQHFKRNVQAVSKVVQERLVLLNEQQKLSEKRLHLFENQKILLDERMNVINEKVEEIGYQKKINNDQLIVIEQQETRINDVESEIAIIKNQFGYRLLKKLRLIKE